MVKVSRKEAKKEFKRRSPKKGPIGPSGRLGALNVES